MASVAARKRGILRRCAPQDDRRERVPQDDKGESAPRNDWLICHSERNEVERRISRLRVRPTGRIHKDGAPRSWNPKKWRAGSSRPTRRQHPSRRSERSGRPHSGVAAIPLHIATASGWKPFGGTTPLRAQRVLKGKGLIRKKGKTAGVPLLVRPPRAAATFPPPAGGEIPCPLGAGTDVAPYKANTPAAPRRCSSLQGPLRQRLTALPPPLKGGAGWLVQAASVAT